jgi:hypothetical protein
MSGTVDTVYCTAIYPAMINCTEILDLFHFDHHIQGFCP